MLIPQPNETTAIARMRVTYGNFHNKRPFSCVGEFCLLTRCLLMDDPDEEKPIPFSSVAEKKGPQDGGPASGRRGNSFGLKT